MRAILTFHAIDDSGSFLSYPLASFAALVATLRKQSIEVCDLDSLLDGRSSPAVAITFDDGLRSVLSALPVLREFAAPAHLFLTVGAVGRDNRWPSQPATAPTLPMLSWSEVERLHGAGWRIESHTVSHPDLRTLPDARVVEECAGADRAIGRRLGRVPRFFAFPYGSLDARVRALVGGRYRACLTTALRPLGSADVPSALPRIDSYYLRHPLLIRRFPRQPVGAYLALRHWIRRARGR